MGQKWPKQVGKNQCFLRIINPIIPGGGHYGPQVRKNGRLVIKCTSNVTKLIENSPNILPKLLVSFLGIFFLLGVCLGRVWGAELSVRWVKLSPFINCDYVR